MIGLTYVREDDSNDPSAAAVEPPTAPLENGSGSGENGTARLPATVTVLKPGGKRVQNVGRCMCSPEQKASGQHIEACFKPPPEETAEEYDQVEPWFDVRYAQVPIASEQLKRWQAAYDEGAKAGLTSPRSSSQVISDDAPMPSHFSLPKRNEFLPTDFELRGTPSSSDDAEEATDKPKRLPPRLLLATTAGCCFYHHNSRWKTPKAILWLGITCLNRKRHATVSEALLNALAVDLTLEALNEESYAATIAGLAYSLVNTARGFASVQLASLTSALTLPYACALLSLIPSPNRLIRVSLSAPSHA